MDAAPGEERVDELAVFTPSYRGDLELFADLHASVLANTAPSVVHHVVVPPSDARHFHRFAGPRCEVWTHRDLLPRRFVSVPRASGLTLNARRPWPPVRGWVMQQIMKLAGTAAIRARAVVIMDSDSVLLRELTLGALTGAGRPWHFRNDDAVDAGMRRHLEWHDVARRLLGVPGRASAPAPDYISPIAVWDPEVVRAMTAHVAQTTGRDWMDAVAGELHVSEFMLYGVFVDEVLGGVEPFRGPLCHNYYERLPLSFAEGRAFAARMPSDAVGAMITSHSRTPRAVRLDAFRTCAEVVGGHPGALVAEPERPLRLEWRGSWERRCLDATVVLAELAALAPAP